MKPRKGKAAAAAGRARVIVTVTALGSAGPLRFLVDDGETVAGLIRAALRCYASEGRMPLLGADPAGFFLYNANGRSDALKADERIGFNGCRSFLLWQAEGKGVTDGKVVSSGWKGGLNKFLLSFSFKV